MKNKNHGADDDGPLVQIFRVVDVIDCVPGNTPREDGTPITILTLAHLDEIEQSMALSVADSKRLVTKLLISLATHGSEMATYLLDNYFDNVRSEGMPDGEDGEAEGDGGEGSEGGT